MVINPDIPVQVYVTLEVVVVAYSFKVSLLQTGPLFVAVGFAGLW